MNPDPLKRVAAVIGVFTLTVLPVFADRTISDRRVKSEKIAILSRSYSDMNMVNSDFSNSSMNKVYFRSVDLKGANFSFANMSDINFEEVNLTYANFHKANFSDTEFEDSKLKNANFSFANLTNSEFDDIDLEGAILYRTNISNVEFDDTKIVNVIIDKSKCCLKQLKIPSSLVFKLLSNDDIYKLKGYLPEIKQQLIDYNTINKDVGMLVPRVNDRDDVF